MNERQDFSEQLSTTPLVISLILIIVLATFIRWNLNPNTIIATADQNIDFSAISAKQMLSDVLGDEIPHPVDSLEIRQTEKRIVNTLRGLGYQEEIQETRICNDHKSRGVRCAQVRNIIVTINGSNDNSSNDNKSGILLSSHYDSVDAGPGASDAGVAVATMLEIARLMSTMPQPKNTIVLLFNEGEEYGLFGARAFMQQHPVAKQLKLAINVEARGSKGSSVMFETGENSGWLVKEYLDQSPKVLSSSLFYEVYKSLPNDTDLTIFKKHGLQGLNFAHAEKLTHYHTPLDNLANLELGTIQHHGDNVWRILQTIKDQNINTPSLAENNLVYTDILGMFSLEWQESTSLTASILMLVLFIYTISRLSKVIRLSKKSIRRGVYSFFIFLAVIPVFGYLFQLGVISLSTTNEPWLTNNFPMQIALWSLLSLITLIGGRLLLKNCQALSVMVGLVSCWIILSITSSYFIVGISFLFLIPSAISILILFLYPYCLSMVKQSILNLNLVIHALVIAIIFMPIVYTLEIMVTYHMTVALSIVFAFIMIGLLPTLSLNKIYNISRIQKTLVITFLIGFVWTIFQPNFDLDSKQRINIYYLQDHTKGAKIIAGHKNNKPAEQLFTTLNAPILTSVFPWSEFDRYNQIVKNSHVKPSIISIDKGENNSTNLSINSVDRTELLRGIRIYIPKESDISKIDFLGKEYSLESKTANSAGYFQFHCIGLHCQSIEMRIEKSTNKLVKIIVVKVLQGLPKIMSRYQENRGDTAHQSQFGDQSYIVSHIEL
ncbi:MAG: hypothetical protein ACJAS9_001135 [Polaribacter sp.]|jgi:hypothetical protein